MFSPVDVEVLFYSQLKVHDLFNFFMASTHIV